MKGKAMSEEMIEKRLTKALLKYTIDDGVGVRAMDAFNKYRYSSVQERIEGYKTTLRYYAGTEFGDHAQAALAEVGA